jgi:hypothetical protein
MEGLPQVTITVAKYVKKKNPGTEHKPNKPDMTTYFLAILFFMPPHLARHHESMVELLLLPHVLIFLLTKQSFHFKHSRNKYKKTSMV